MDILESLGSAKGTFKRIKYSTPIPVACPAAQDNSDTEMVSEDEEEPDYEKNTANYAEEYRMLEREKYQLAAQQQGAFMCVETNTVTTLSAQRESEVCKQIYDTHRFDTRLRTEPLAIDSYKDEIISLIKTNSIVIIEGPTGCGKSTQVPQFILDDCKENREYCNIVVTQPRRIAAITLALRVCDERSWSHGDVCGYQVGLEKSVRSNTILTYVTTGVLLHKLINQRDSFGYTHVIVDEIHERDQNMDFLLVLLRKLLLVQALDVKIVLMSATFDTEKFSQYFRNNSRLGFDISAPIVSISHGNRYRVQVYYIEQLKALAKVPEYSVHEPKVDESLYECMILLITAFDKLDEGSNKCGSVLVFLPGIMEIEEAYNLIAETSLKRNGKWLPFPLHSAISSEEQRVVFGAVTAGYRKIILATNIAESSITVNDIVYVIDFCLTKQMVVDPDTQYESLRLQWASQNSCIQRAGRVGRVSDGRVYRLVPRDFFEREMTQESIPEILRCPLDRVVLFSKMLELNEPPQAILALLMDPPNLSNIESTIWKLKEVGALLPTWHGKTMTIDGDLTIMGKIMARLPLDIRMSKLIILGHIFSCLDETIIMAAGCSLHNIFVQPFQAHLRAYTNKLTWADGSCSDLIAYLNLFRVYDQHKRLNNMNKHELYKWSNKNFLNYRCLQEWEVLVKEIRNRLSTIGVVASSGEARVHVTDSELPLVLKVAIAGAFYPNYFKRTKDADQIDEREAVREVGGRDPFTTVYFKNMDSQQPGPLYAKRIKESLSEISSNMNVSFESSKVFVQFMKFHQHETVKINGRDYLSSIPGKICMDVYRAVRRRQLKLPTNLAILSVSEAWRRFNAMKARNDELKNSSSTVDPDSMVIDTDGPVIPTCDVVYIRIQITSRIDAAHFWAQNDDEQTVSNVSFIERELNTRHLKPVQAKVVVGQLYAGVYADNDMYYRCRVINVSHFGKDRIPMAQIMFIDYGNTDTVPVDRLRELPSEAIKNKPPQAMECVMINVQPSLVQNPRAIWSQDINTFVKRETEKRSIYGKVYSVVNGVVHLELFKQVPGAGQETSISLNEYLIGKGYAEFAEESYLSKMNHEKRRQLQNNEFCYNQTAANVEEEVVNHNVVEMQPPRVNECSKVIHLRGPFSPLEMKIYSCTEFGAGKSVTLDGLSVNAALLDSNPEDPHDRLVVAAQIHQNTEGTTLNLKGTTIMPNIVGFPVLMSLLFCPRMEPKLSEDGTFIAAMLFGLGYQGTSKSLYRAHDMVFVLDTKLETEDLVAVNEMRYWMNVSLETMANIYDNVPPIIDPGYCQFQAKEHLFKILKRKNTESIPRTPVKYADTWNKFKFKGKMLEPEGAGITLENIVWPLHWTFQLHKTSENDELKKHLVLMQDMATKTIPTTEIICKLCNITIRDIHEMRVHLSSEIHMNAVKRRGI